MGIIYPGLFKINTFVPLSFNKNIYKHFLKHCLNKFTNILFYTERKKGDGSMYLNSFDDVKDITRDLVAIPSVVGAKGQETACAKKVYDFYSALPYFQERPNQVYLLKTENDVIDRHNAIAYVKGTKGKSNKTVILMGHIDTVGIDDFSPEQCMAFDSEKIKSYLLQTKNIEDLVKRDIHSGEYFFGRGSLDMKSGVAAQMYVMKYFSEHPEELNGNIVAIAHCDEEDMSHGILTGLIDFERLKKEEQFEFIASINSDYTTPMYEGDENRYIYYGAVGKLLPSFYVIGRETHVGQPYGGLDPNLITAELTKRIDLNVELCDEALGETTFPPISLKQSDLKELYTVQTANKAYCYYNFFTHSMSPKDVLEKVRKIAVESFNSVISEMNCSYQKYCSQVGYDYLPLGWKCRVYTYEEFYKEVLEIRGLSFENHMREFSVKLNKEEPYIDLRIFSIKMLEEAWKFHPDQSPAIIIYFSSSYCPRVEITGKNDNEKRLIEAVEKAVNDEKYHCKNPIVTKYFFPYISDASFMAVCDDEDSLISLKNNMPAWGDKYSHKVEDILKINVPVVNVGSHGYDGHKYTERVHEAYTFGNVPNMIYKTVCNLLY